MAQQDSLLTRTHWSYEELEMNRWDQVAWFVEFGNTKDFRGMSQGQKLGWQEQIEAMQLRAQSWISVPAPIGRFRKVTMDRRRFTYLPNLLQMQKFRDRIANHLNDIADG